MSNETQTEVSLPCIEKFNQGGWWEVNSQTEPAARIFKHNNKMWIVAYPSRGYATTNYLDVNKISINNTISEKEALSELLTLCANCLLSMGYNSVLRVNENNAALTKQHVADQFKINRK